MLATLKLHTSVCECGAPIERYVGVQKPLRTLATEDNGLYAFAATFIDAPSILDHAGHKVIGLLLPEHRISPLHAGWTQVAESLDDAETTDDGESESDEGSEDAFPGQDMEEDFILANFD